MPINSCPALSPAAGTVPPGWNLPPALESLSIGFNALTGTFPEALALPPSLQQLSVPW